MKFRFKMTLAMLCLVALIFGIGGSMLISLSFQGSLEREKAAAQKSYQMIIDTVSIVNSMDALAKSEDVASMLDQMFSHTTSSWEALRLSNKEGSLFEAGALPGGFIGLAEDTEFGYCAISSVSDNRGGHHLHIAGNLLINNEVFVLEAAQDISGLYEVRAQQERAYQIIFCTMMMVCALGAYGISWLLTRPLSKLSRASKEIASGNFSYRSRIRTNDEIGELSVDFDIMAHQVEKSIKQMEETMESQERFMGSFAHELKTPMTALIGYADLLRKQDLTAAEQLEAAQYIFSESKRLESLSLKLLDLFMADKSNLKFTWVSCADLVEEVVALLKPAYEKEGIALHVRAEKGDCFLEPDLVKSLLINLLDNAKKSSSAGSVIFIETKMIPGGCRLYVQDQGKGIPQEALSHITEAFYRVDTARSRAEGGAGLGLSLVAKIVSLHGGRLRVQSQVGKGTRMCVELKGGRL